MNNKLKILGGILFIAGFILSVSSLSTINSYVVYEGLGNYSGGALGIALIVLGMALFLFNREETWKKAVGSYSR
jgi:hypothetical protein